jgi:hypothetical protein
MNKYQIGLLIILGSICLYYFGAFSYHLCYPKKYTRCGVVVDKHFQDELHIGRHSGRIHTYQYLYVRFNDNHKVEEVTVEPNTYHENHNGSIVCFTREENAFKQYGFLGLMAALIGAVEIIAIIVVIMGGIWTLLGAITDGE